MYCPQCHAEYVAGKQVCADCKVTLVDHLPPDLSLEEINWVAVQDYPGNIFAEMVGEILDKNHIPHFAKSDWFTSAYSISSVNLPGTRVTVYVPEEYVEQARTVLDTLVD